MQHSSVGLKQEAYNFHDALEDLASKKGGWSTSKRNELSGDLMQNWHMFLSDLWAETRAAEVAIDRGVIEIDLARSRFGALYILGQLEVEDDAAMLLGSLASMAAGGFLIAGGEGAIDAEDAFVGAESAWAAGGGARGAAAKPAGKLQNKRLVGGPQQDLAFPGFEFPRTKEQLEAFGDRDAKDYSLLVAGAALGGPAAAVAALEQAPVAAAAVLDTVESIGNNLYVVGYKALAFVFEKIMGDNRTKWKAAGKIVKTILKFVVTSVLDVAADILRSGIRLGEGLVKFIHETYSYFKARYQRRSVELQPGHFTLISKSIENSILWEMAAGFKDALVGAGALALNASTAGLGRLVTLITDALEWAVQIFTRHLELGRINAFLAKTKDIWAIEQAKCLTKQYDVDKFFENPDEYDGEWLADLKPVEGRMNSLIDQPDAFAAWFKEGCEASVVIPMLTLNSGYCGSITDQIMLLSGRGADRMVDAETAMKGAAYFAGLKRRSSIHLANCGFKFKGSDSAQQIFDFAVRQHLQMSQDWAEKAGAFLGR
jgi:hypothetical protein